MTHDERKVYVPMPDSYHGGTITFGGYQKGRITSVGKIGIHPYPSSDNVLFIEGL